jgi:hypothetical protein
MEVPPWLSFSHGGRRLPVPGAQEGPWASGGKEAVRRNALKNGLLVEEVLLPGEDADSFQDLSDCLYSDLFDPLGRRRSALLARCFHRDVFDRFLESS